ncbi:MAG: hypothetical protein ACTSU2_14025 [Promethearchaeota archaeon]
MSFKDVDEFLKEDIDEIKDLEEKYKETKDINLLIQIARKYSELADLYYAADEDFNSRFFMYKEKSAETYEKLSKDHAVQAIRLNSLILSILNYIQAAKPETAEKKLKKLRKSQEKEHNKEIDENILLILEYLMYPNIKEAGRFLRNYKSLIDDTLYKELKKTLDFLKKMKE